MNEEIKKNEIPEDALENVSGGAGFSAAPKTSPKSGGVIGFACGMCDHMENV